jgi:hypothetical protein
MMKKWVIIFAALALLVVSSVGYAEAKADSPKGKSCIIFQIDKDLAGTVFTVDKDLEKIQKFGY